MCTSRRFFCFSVLLLPVVACLLAGCAPKTPPQAAFTAAPVSGTAPLMVNFTDMSLPGSGQISAWVWDFGDGQSSTERSPSHIYSLAGNYNVTLAVTSDIGADTSAPQQIEVSEITGEGEGEPEGEGEGEPEGEGEGEGEIEGDGELTVTFTWPTTKRSDVKANDFSAAQSLSIRTEGQTQTINRPVTTAIFDQLAPGEHFVTMTLFDGLDGAGTILSRGSCIVIIGTAGGARLRLGSDQTLVQSLVINTSEDVVLVHNIAQLTAVGLSVDEMVVLLPSWSVQWTSLTPQYGGVSSTGMVTGMNPGTLTIRAALTETVIQKDIDLPVEQLTISFEPGLLEVPSNGSLNVKVLLSHTLPEVPGTEYLLRWNSNGAWGMLIDPSSGQLEDWVETPVGAPQITAHANKRADMFLNGFACYLVRKWGPTSWDRMTVGQLTSDVRVRGLTFSAPITLKAWESGWMPYWGCGDSGGTNYYNCGIFITPISIPADASEFRAVITTDGTHPTISNGAIREGISFGLLDDGTYVSNPLCVASGMYQLIRQWGECPEGWTARQEAALAETEPLLRGLVSALVEVVQ